MGVAQSLILTSLVFLIIGLIFVSKTRSLLQAPNWAGLFIPMGLILSPMLMFNATMTPAYPTLTFFGSAALLVYFLYSAYSPYITYAKLDNNSKPQLLPGLSMAAHLG